MKKEIERKFLIKDLPIDPSLKLPEIQHIIQYYYKHESVWKRIRKIESNISGQQFLHTVKTYKDGITYEEEKLFSYLEYKELISMINSGEYPSRFISKTRYILPTEIQANFEGEIKTIKWEFDKFNFNLMIAEIELPSFDFPLEIPDFIKEKIIYEVTNISEFSNRNLAQPLRIKEFSL